LYSFVVIWSASGYRWHQQDLISVLKGVTTPAQESDVLFVDINIQEPANRASFIAQMRL